MTPASLGRAERLTLAVLMCGVASLALSDFVSPGYWLLAAVAAVLRLWIGPRLALSEMQASLIGWSGFLWVGLELVMGRAWVVAFTDFLLILALAVTIEMATPRNHLHRMLVGLFLLLAAAVLTDSVLYILPLTAFLWFMWRAAACLYGMNWPGGDLPQAPATRDMKIMAGIVLATAIGFVALPRFDVHSLLKPTQPRMETSGFSDSVQLGDFARELDPTVVMRIEAVGMEPARMWNLMSGRYWRGVVLDHFTGTGWQRLIDPDVLRVGRGQTIRFGADDGFKIAVYREASDHGFIQLPEGLQSISELPEATALGRSSSLHFVHAPSRRLRLQMVLSAHPSLPAGMAPPLARESNAGEVPAAVKEWVRTFAQAGGTPEQTLDRIVAEMKGWQYDLNAPIDPLRPVASFLQNRRGHCELYATALALAARELGFPARVVNGYYGGEWNEVGQFLLIRQQHAHSWVEVWENSAWKRLDSTPAMRWELSGVRFPVFDEVWETVRMSWYRYVLEFQNQDRAGLAKSALQMLRQYGGKLVAGTLILLLLGYLVRSMLGRWHRPSGSVGMIDRWLRAHGVERLPHQPLRLLPVPRDADDAAWYGFVREWERQTYAGAPAWSRRKIRRELRALSARHC